MRRLLLISFTFIFCCLTYVVEAQYNWSLKRCIDHALQNNLTIKRAQNDVLRAEVRVNRSKNSRLPNLNASINGGYQFGRTINPITNSFENMTVGSNSISMSGGATLFNLNRINNTIKQSELDLASTKLISQATANDLSLNVATAFLNILLGEEQLENAQKQLEQTTNQLEQTEKLIQAGSLPENEKLDILAQKALNEQSIIEAQNLVRLGYLNLQNLLQLPPQDNFTIAAPEITVPDYVDPSNFNFQNVYETALKTQPNIMAGELALQSANYGVDIAKADLYPRLTVFASLSSAYSNQVRDFLQPNNDNAQFILTPGQDVQIDGIPAEIAFFQEIGVEYPKKSYFDQMNDNFGQTIGLTLNIPIYNNYLTSANIQNAKISVLDQDLNNKQTLQQLQSDVQTAINNALASKESYEASLVAVEAAETAFENAQKRYDLGAINSLEYTTSLNNLDRARINLITSKYQYIFNLKVIDFYLGKELILD